MKSHGIQSSDRSWYLMMMMKCNFSLRLKRSLLILTTNLNIEFEARIVKDCSFCKFLKTAQALNNFNG